MASYPSRFTTADGHATAEGFSIMFERLQKKWKVGGLQLALIICTFAIGGSLTGFAGKKIMNGLAIQQDWLWAIVYILLITIIWPMAVIDGKYSFRAVSFFYQIYQEDRGEDGSDEESGVGRQETGDRRVLKIGTVILVIKVKWVIFYLRICLIILN